MSLKPIADRVILKSVELEEKTEGGIILPSNAKEKPCTGTVIAVGSGKVDVKMEVKEGDKVIYSKYAETEVEIGGEKYIIVNHNDILAIID